MSAERVLAMIGRMILNRLIRRAVDAGIDKAAGTKTAREDMDPAERRRDRAARDYARRAKRAMRAARRFGRF